MDNHKRSNRKRILEICVTFILVLVLLAGCSFLSQDEANTTPEPTTEVLASTSPTEAPATPTLNPTPSPVPENSTFEIRFLDVGEADAALVTCDGKAMLIDGGNPSDSSMI